jgi:alcohol dehydrogenase class IV
VTDLQSQRVFMAWPSRVIFGAGERRILPSLLKSKGYKKALLVTDVYFTERSPIIAELIAELDAEGLRCIVFDGGQPDPSVDLCVTAFEWAQAQAGIADLDHIIAVGGGSNIDLAKVLSVTLKFGGDPEDYVGEGRLPGKPLPLVAIPTTSGAGSEITPGAILIGRNTATKVALMGNDLRPAIVMVDPELTLSCPKTVTAHAGLDALTHAVESYLTCDSIDFDRGDDPDPGYSGRNLITQLMAGEAIRLCFAHLPTAYENGADLNARTGMAYGSLLAAFSYANAGLNAVHALAYALAGLTHATHGATNAVFLPYVLDNMRSVRQADLAQIARFAGLAEQDEESMARAAVVHIRTLVGSLGVPTDLQGVGVSKDERELLVKNGLAVARLTKAYPVRCAESAYRDIVERAFHGVLEAAEQNAVGA